MLSPHESLNLNPKRGLLAAVIGNPATYPGLVVDLRRPRRTAATRCCSRRAPVARFGHESGFSPDGKTFYATGTAHAVDHRDRRDRPEGAARGLAGQRHLARHDAQRRRQPRLHRRPDRRQHADPRHQPDPGAQAEPAGARDQPADLDAASIPQNAIPFTDDGQPYVLEFDEYTQAHDSAPATNGRGRRRADHRHRRRDARRASIVQPAPRRSTSPPTTRAATRRPRRAAARSQGYAAHYCNIPTRVDPKIVACSFIASGLRVFDISDLAAPEGDRATSSRRPQPRAENGAWRATSRCPSPRSCPTRREIWYTDGTSGFYALRMTNGAWPFPSASAAGVPADLQEPPRVHDPHPRPARPAAAERLGEPEPGQGGTSSASAAASARRSTCAACPSKRSVTVKVRAKTYGGKTVVQARRYKTCTRRR